MGTRWCEGGLTFAEKPANTGLDQGEDVPIDYTIIPDIHGHADKLDRLLARLGWRVAPSGIKAPTPNSQLIFLGDFIDRGKENAQVINTVRRLIDAGKARAIMGNHELNAIHYHTNDPKSGRPLRRHSPKNQRQHADFLREAPLGSPKARDLIGWMRGLPLYLETPDFRAVHACWDETAIAALAQITDGGVLSQEQIIGAATRSDPIYDLTEITAKGPETNLPPGHSIADKEGNVRKRIRIKWWASKATTWQDIAMSVPDLDALPRTPLPKEIVRTTYPAAAKPVFFGHYWLTGAPQIQAKNALCLDYSAGLDGPLIAYRMDAGADGLSLDNLVMP